MPRPIWPWLAIALAMLATQPSSAQTPYLVEDVRGRGLRAFATGGAALPLFLAPGLLCSPGRPREWLGLDCEAPPAGRANQPERLVAPPAKFFQGGYS